MKTRRAPAQAHGARPSRGIASHTCAGFTLPEGITGGLWPPEVYVMDAANPSRSAAPGVLRVEAEQPPCFLDGVQRPRAHPPRLERHVRGTPLPRGMPCGAHDRVRVRDDVRLEPRHAVLDARGAPRGRRRARRCRSRGSTCAAPGSASNAGKRAYSSGAITLEKRSAEIEARDPSARTRSRAPPRGACRASRRSRAARRTPRRSGGTAAPRRTAARARSRSTR